MTIKSLVEKLNITLDQAHKLRALIAGKADPRNYDSVDQWYNSCYYKPCDTELVLAACNEVLGGFGVEYIEHESDGFDFFSLCGLSYVNLGDTYKTTIIYNHAKDKFVINCWGSFVEKSNKYL